MSDWPYRDIIHGTNDRTNGGGRTSIDNDKATGPYGSDAFAFTEQGSLVREADTARNYETVNDKTSAKPKK
jgi:hypothetical protein